MLDTRVPLATAANTDRRSGHRVLVVDDDPGIRDLLADILSEHGHDVVKAENGAAALQQLQDGGRPCLMLLDLMMPIMNGWQLAAQLQQDKELKSIPFVLVSAYPMRGWDARQFGAASSLSKPLDLDELLGIVERHCGAKQAIA